MIALSEVRTISMLAEPVLDRLQLLAKYANGNVLEIGPYIGGSTVALASGHQGRLRHAVIDLGGSYADHDLLPSADIIADWTANMKRFGTDSYASIFQGWSTDSRVFLKALDHIERKIGLFFFDGDGKCAEQFAIFWRYMNPGCAIVLDDYLVDTTYGQHKADLVRPWVDRMVASGALIPDQVIDGTWFGNLGVVTPFTFRHYAHAGGYAWLAPAPHPDEALIEVWENCVQLGPGQSMHERVRRIGRGAYSHWMLAEGPRVVFSTSDNSDPNTTWRLYEFRVRDRQAPWLGLDASGGGIPDQAVSRLTGKK
jgi:hypothetical protein